MTKHDAEFNYNSDDEVSENHSKLIDAVRQFDKGQRIKKPKRSEPSLEISEFHLVKSGITNENAIEIEDLAKTLGEKGHHDNLRKKINSAKVKSKVLSKPLEKPVAEKIKRVVGFENTRKELTKWTGIIARNRTAASISFPLSQSSMKLTSSDDYVKRFRLQSELEQKLAQLEPKNESVIEKDDFPLTLEEILERRKEAAKFRAQQSYKEAKAHRQNKIKSKKFHRIQRKERIKKALKEFEELQKTDPQAALEKLEQLDKTRAEERMTLRHKSTGQWAKNKQVRAKYDSNSRQMLAEQLSISRELTQKIQKNEESEEDEENLDQHINLLKTEKENPWIKSAKSQSEIDEFISGYRKYWNEHGKLKNQNTVNKNEITANDLNENVELVKELKMTRLHEGEKSAKVFEEMNSFEIKENNKQANDLSSIKKSNQKLNDSVKSRKIKTVKTEENNSKSGTTCWSVSSVKTANCDILKQINNVDIDDMFESVDDKLQKQIDKKHSKVKNMLRRETKYENKIKKQKRNNDSINDTEQLSLRGQTNLKPVINKPIEETISSQQPNEIEQTKEIINNVGSNNCKISKSNITEIDPKKFMNMKPKYLKTLIPDDVGGEDEVIDNEAAIDQHQIISEAFADDNIVDEFREEKEEEVKKNQPENVNLSLPGWGSWGGKNIKQSSRKKRRFIIKVANEVPRRDENKGDVVIIEEKCPKIKQHLVSELPFPFTSVQDFEASIRAPLGRDFVPEKTFNKLIQPAIKTKMGKIIEPMTEDILVKAMNLKKRKKPETKEESKSKKPRQNKSKNNYVNKNVKSVNKNI